MSVAGGRRGWSGVRRRTRSGPRSRPPRGEQAEPALGDRLAQRGRNVTDHTQPGDTAVRVDVQPDLPHRRGRMDPEPVLGVRQQPGPRQQLSPVLRVGQPGRTGRITHEPGGVDDHMVQQPGHGQPDHQPVVAVIAAPLRLPAVRHDPRPPRGERVARCGVEHVAARGHLTAGQHGGQVHPAPEPPRIGHDLTEGAQPGHAPIRLDPEPDVRHDLVRRGHRHQVGLVPGQPGHLGEGRPARRQHFVQRRVAEQRGAVQHGRGRVVATEVRGVDVHPAQHRGRGQPDNGEVLARFPAPPGLPAVVQLAADAEGRRVVAGWPGFDQVARIGEELVVGEPHRAAQHPAGHVRQPAERGPYRLLVRHRRLPPGPAGQRAGRARSAPRPAMSHGPTRVAAGPGRG